MTLLLLMNLGFAESAVVPSFNPAWAMNRNQVVGPTFTQPVRK